MDVYFEMCFLCKKNFKKSNLRGDHVSFSIGFPMGFSLVWVTLGFWSGILGGSCEIVLLQSMIHLISTGIHSIGKTMGFIQYLTFELLIG